MRGVIKGVLAEELENSIRMKKGFEEALGKLPKGCLVSKKIRGHEYYYLVVRQGGKVKYFYKGKVSGEEKDKYTKAKALRAKYRKSFSQIKKQIRFLRGALRGKEAI